MTEEEARVKRIRTIWEAEAALKNGAAKESERQAAFAKVDALGDAELSGNIRRTYGHSVLMANSNHPSQKSKKLRAFAKR